MIKLKSFTVGLTIVHLRYGRFSMMVMERLQLVLYGTHLLDGFGQKREMILKFLSKLVSRFLEWSLRRTEEKLMRKRK